MPLATFKSVYCVSSEDKAHPAKNLLLNYYDKKWKCESTGESSVYVILELEKSSQITAIDIGNEHSAFIAVLVGRTGWMQENYREILLTSSFMTPMEGRNSETPNRVRCFAKNALISPVCDEKWDLVKFICTQPFNKHVKYGLSFVKVYCIDDDVKKPVEPKAGVNWLSSGNAFGRFKIREESPDSDKDEKSLSLFSKWKQEKNSPVKDGSGGNLSAAAAIRDASCSAGSAKKYPSSKLSTPRISKPSTKVRQSSDDDDSKEEDATNDRNRQSLMYDREDDAEANPRLELEIIKDRERIEKEKDEKRKAQKRVTTTPKASGSKENSTPKQETNRDSSKKMESSSKKFKDFIDISADNENDGAKLENVEEKSTPRTDKRIANGSASSLNSTKFYPSAEKQKRESNDLNSSFSMNKKRLSSSLDSIEPERKKIKTPTKNIIYKPFGKLLEGVVLVISGIQNPDRAEIRDKAIKMGARYKPDWDTTCTHLICAFKNTPKYNQVKGHGKIVKKDWIIQCHSQQKRISWRRHALDSKEMDKPESEDEICDLAKKPSGNALVVDDDDSSVDCSGSDIPRGSKDAQTVPTLSDSDTEAYLSEDSAKSFKMSIYDMETDEEPEKDKNDHLDASQASGDLFKDKYFYISGNVGAVEEIKLRRTIVDHEGCICARTSRADYIISNESHDDESDNRKVVKPLWIYECNHLNRILPIDRYKP